MWADLAPKNRPPDHEAGDQRGVSWERRGPSATTSEDSGTSDGTRQPFGEAGISSGPTDRSGEKARSILERSLANCISFGEIVSGD